MARRRARYAPDDRCQGSRGSIDDATSLQARRVPIVTDLPFPIPSPPDDGRATRCCTSTKIDRTGDGAATIAKRSGGVKATNILREGSLRGFTSPPEPLESGDVDSLANAAYCPPSQRL